MTSRRLLLAFLFSMAISAISCKREDIDRLRRVGKKTGEKLGDATANARSRVAESLESLQAQSPLPSPARLLQLRLRSDKLLSELSFQIVFKEGDAEIRGTVKVVDQKDRALDLARTTVGVEKVIDAITISDNP